MELRNVYLDTENPACIIIIPVSSTVVEILLLIVVAEGVLNVGIVVDFFENRVIAPLLTLLWSDIS